MAESPAHRFGQIIGDALEAAIRPILQAVATDLGMYLDTKGARQARGTKRKVAWVDARGNSHDLDYVFEAGGSDETLGTPRAFIEIAWRRYTKHSRNKAQEIQGAILPLAERFRDQHPFLGVILGGVFTTGSLDQLRSNGFHVLHFPYESLLEAFAAVGVDAEFDENTADAVLLRKVRAYEKLTPAQLEAIARYLRDRHREDLNAFTASLRIAMTRRIESVFVLTLHGTVQTLDNVNAAIAFIETFDQSTPSVLFVRYEVGVRFTNGDEIRGQFTEKAPAVRFLRSLDEFEPRP